MYNRESPADAYLDELLDDQQMRSQERGWPDSWESIWPFQRLVLWAYERQQASKRLPDDHPLRQPDEVFWTEERQNMASELAQAYVEDMMAVDWWDEQTEYDKRTYILNQEEAMNDGSHN